MTNNGRTKRSAKPIKTISYPNMDGKTWYTFNFSFLTRDKKYSLVGLTKRDCKIHRVLLEKITFLSELTVLDVLALRRQQGLESLTEHDVTFRVNETFAQIREKQLEDSDYWIFRIGNLGRVIGGIQVQIAIVS